MFYPNDVYYTAAESRKTVAITMLLFIVASIGLGIVLARRDKARMLYLKTVADKRLAEAGNLAEGCKALVYTSNDYVSEVFKALAKAIREAWKYESAKLEAQTKLENLRGYLLHQAQMSYSFGELVADVDWNLGKTLSWLVYHRMPTSEEFAKIKETVIRIGSQTTVTSVYDVREPKLNSKGLWVSELSTRPEVDCMPSQNHLRKRVEAPVFLSLKEKGASIPIPLKSAHTLVVGNSGSGKTETILYLLHSIALMAGPNDLLIIIDPKMGGDFKPLRGVEGYYGGEDSQQGFNKVIELLELWRKNPEVVGDRRCYVVIDELSSLATSYERSERKAFDEGLGRLLRLGRNLGDEDGGISVVTGIQRPDATYLGSSEVRDNYNNRLYLGRTSPEGLKMMFSESAGMSANPIGKGWLEVDGKAPERVLIPRELPEHREVLYERVQNVMERSLG